jgi:hypothetical protein
MPFTIPPFTTYGFEQQDDGSFTNPFVITISGSGGCMVAGGINIYPNADGSAHALFSWNDLVNGIEFAQMDIPTLGEDIAVATWSGNFGAGGQITNMLFDILNIPHAAAAMYIVLV